MKKNNLARLALLACSLFAFSFSNAQTTIMYQNFEASKTVAPAGWTQEKTTIDKGWEFNNKYGTNMANYVATHTYCAFVDDWDNNTAKAAGYDTLYSPSMNCSTYPHVFISLSDLFWNDNGNETGTIAVSTDGGKTWNTAVNFTDNGGAWADSAIYDLTPYAAGQANVMLAFTYYNGYATTTNGYVAVGMGVDNIDVYSPLGYDLSVVSQNLQYLMQAGKAYTFTGAINNYGSDSIVSMHLNYSVNGGLAQTDNITGITGFNGLTVYNFSHSIPFTPAAGSYKVKFWADNLNGTNVDQNHKNDTLVAYFMAVDSVQPKRVLYEEGTGQSCVYCMLAAPNLDSVIANVGSYCDVISYHVPIPTTPDYMYSVTSPTTDTRANYYGVYSNGTPDAFMDGYNNLYPGALAAPNDFSTPIVSQEAAVGSPFKIKITNCTYNTTLNQYSLSASITAYGAFASGLIAQVALVSDSITYTQDYSSDDPTASFAPPIGTGTGGSYPGAPDYLYPYVLKFPHVVEQMLPNGNGTALSSFTAGQTQNVNVTWTKNHTWSLDPKTYPYDSSATMHMVIFVQSNSAIPAAGIPAKYVFQSASSLVTTFVGINELSNSVSFNMYPNPTNGNTNIVFALAQEQNVNIDVYNILGENVYSVNQGKMGTGQHNVVINSNGLAAGVYTVKFTSNNASTTQKLVITK